MEIIINQKIAYAERQVTLVATSDKVTREIWGERLERLLQWRDNFRALACQ